MICTSLRSQRRYAARGRLTPHPKNSLFAGKYRIDGMLGEGGMGVVVAATHLALGRQVAIKFLRPEVASNGELVERMMREARSAALLRSEHVARVLDVGAEDGSPYIVLELLVGEDLASLLRRGPVPPSTAVHYILQAAEALAEAHAAKIIHRDIKPQNLFLTQRASDGTPLIKVLDFGISKAERDGASSLTTTRTVIGTPAYMPPEQLRSARSVDQRGDIWALGVCLYELISGHRPFEGEAFSELCLKIGIDPVPPMSTPYAEDLSGVGSVVFRCLQKNPAQRFQSIVELAAALAPFAADQGWIQYQHCVRLSGGVPNAPHAVTPSPSWPSPTTQRHAAGQLTAPVRSRRIRSVWISGGVAGTIMLAVGLSAGRGGGEEEDPAVRGAFQLDIPTQPELAILPDAALLDAGVPDAHLEILGPDAVPLPRLPEAVRPPKAPQKPVPFIPARRKQAKPVRTAPAVKDLFNSQE